MKKKVCACILAALLAATSLTGCIKVVKTGEEAALTGATEFNAGDNVSEFWETTALPEMEGKAIDIVELLNLVGDDMNLKSGEDYAKYSMGTSGELTYTVKGTGTITEVEKEKKAGYITLKLDGYDGSYIVKIQIGSVFKGTSVRDSLNFINFNDYTNQVEWAAVSTSINELIQSDVIDAVGYDAFETGKTVEFVGAFTVGTGDEILITPTELSVN